MKKNAILIIMAFFCCAMFFSEDKKENILPNLHIYTLQNNFTIFINEEKNVSMPQVKFVCRAGYSHQGRANAGFLDLYSKLFLSSANKDFIQSLPIESASNADSVTYTCSLNMSSLDEYIKQISQCAVNPSFAKSDIEKEYSAMKDKIAEYQKSAAGFLNSAIETRMFPDEPWKQSFGIDLQTFSSYSIPQVTAMLEEIRSAYYTPDNAIIIITGNVDVKKTAQTVSKYFSKWSGSYSGSATKQNTKKFPSQKKYVLPSSIFSKDLAQIAVQYTEFSKPEAKIAEIIFCENDSPFVQKELSEKKLGIRGSGYLASQSTSERNSDRLILQGIMEGTEPAVQADLFVQKAKEAFNANAITQAQFNRAKNSQIASFNISSGEGLMVAKEIASFWTYNENVTAKTFYSAFSNYYKSIENLSYSDFILHAKNQTPFVFIMINSDDYKRNESLFKEKGYELITQESAAWYGENSYNISAGKKKPEETSVTETPHIQNADSKYYIDNAKTLSSAKLSNSIPLIVKTNSGTKTATISIAIAGGELCDFKTPNNNPYLRTVLINAFTNCIQNEADKLKDTGRLSGNTKIRAWTTEVTSYITIECLTSELKTTLIAAVNAIIYGEISPQLADELVNDLNYQQRIKQGSLSYQLRAKAMQYMYRGTDFEPLYKEENQQFVSMNYQTISLAYTELLNASLYSIVIVGDISLNQAKSFAETSFGLLKKQNDSEKIKIQSPKYKPDTLTVQLSHTYTPSQSSTPSEAPVLVPTKKFYDPMQFYFTSPEYSTQRELFNALLFELELLTEKDLGKDYECLTQRATSIQKFAMLEAEKLLHKKSFISSFANARKKLYKELSDEKTSDKIIKEIRSIWNYKTMINTQTNEGTARLIQEGILEGNKNLYLDSYMVIENATAKDFLNILDKYIPAKPELQVFSADSKQ